MKSLCLFPLFFVALSSTHCQPRAHDSTDSKNSPLDLTVERIHGSPSLSGATPRGLKFSPDSKRLTYLKAKKENKLVLDLWEFNLESKTHQLLVDSQKLLGSKNETLSEEEKSRRERLRIRNSGIISFQWNEQGTAILFPLSGDLYLYELKSKAVTRITNTKEAETDGRFSPKGNFISYVRDQDVFIYDVKKKSEKAVTFGGEDTIKNGMAEFVSQEEMGRLTGYWWSKDEKYIAYTQIDESPVKIDTRTEINADNTIVKKQRYPYTGTPNVKIKLFITELNAPKKKISIPLGADEDIYLARATWHPNKSTLYYQVQSRNQKTLSLVKYDVETKKSKTILKETSKAWVNILGEPKFLKESDQFIWRSEKSGFNHLYLYKNDGTFVRQITKGPWVVTKLAGVNEKEGLLYFLSTQESPTERHLYKKSFLNEEKSEKLTDQHGTYGATFSKDTQFYIQSFSNTSTPPNVQLKNSKGEHLTWLEKNKVDSSHPLFPIKDQLADYQFDTFKIKEDVTLHYSLLKPKNFNPKKKYPLIVYVYGGPHAQLVRNAWIGNRGLLFQLMAASGYLVLTVDNRGSNYRGTAFEFPIHLKMADIEVKDQIEGLNHIIDKGFVDKTRIGVTGHSYGGYMTLMLMAQHPEVFKAGVSGAPVTDWKLYDTHYTERYMSTPQKNPDGYKFSNVLTHAKNIKGDLLVVHGMADDNVLFKNSTMLFYELQKNGITFDSMTYPGAKHGLYGKENQIHYYKSILRHFKNYL